MPFGLVNAVANTGLDGLPDKLKTQLPAEIDRGQVAHLTLFALALRYEGPTLTPTLTPSLALTLTLVLTLTPPLPPPLTLPPVRWRTASASRETLQRQWRAAARL